MHWRQLDSLDQQVSLEQTSGHFAQMKLSNKDVETEVIGPLYYSPFSHLKHAYTVLFHSSNSP